jgi:LAO/AO transport system kinase
VINKRDLPGADKLRMEVEYVLSFKSPEAGVASPVVMVSAAADDGIDEVADAMSARLESSRADGSLESKRRFRIRQELQGILTRKIHDLMDVHIEFSKQLPDWVDELYRKQAQPYALVNRQIQRFLTNKGKEGTP